MTNRVTKEHMMTEAVEPEVAEEAAETAEEAAAAAEEEDEGEPAAEAE